MLVHKVLVAMEEEVELEVEQATKEVPEEEEGEAVSAIKAIGWTEPLTICFQYGRPALLHRVLYSLWLEFHLAFSYLLRRRE